MKLSREQINTYYNNAINYFKENHPEFNCFIEDGFFVVKYNYANDTYFNGSGISKYYEDYKCKIFIKSNGKFLVVETIDSEDKSLSTSDIGYSKSGFAGRIWNYSKEYSIGKNNNTEETGVIEHEFNTTSISKPVIDYFKSLGLKYVFFSYSLSLKSIEPIGKILATVLPIIIGLIFIIVGIQSLIFFLFPGIIVLLIGIFNIYEILKKEN